MSLETRDCPPRSLFETYLVVGPLGVSWRPRVSWNGTGSTGLDIYPSPSYPDTHLPTREEVDRR